jgi:ectoine hydroxylase-related dioxygenase (phytanoyl-CoA dioxygenase family)
MSNTTSTCAAMPDIDDAAGIQAFWQENGYYVARGVFSTPEVAELEGAFDAIVQQLQQGGEDLNARWSGATMDKMDGGKSVILHTHNVQCFSAAWLRALLHPRFLKATTAILGEDVVLHHTKLFQKPSEKGAPFPMHQDWTYFPSFKDTMMAGIIHVSDATDEMGCLRVYPGSHKLGRVEGTSGTQASELLERYPIEEATILEAQAGDVAFFHYFTLHGSMPNASDKTRKTVLAQMHAGDDEIEPRGLSHPYARLTLNGWNKRATRSSANAIK